MATLPLQIGNGYFGSKSKPLSVQNCVNCYPHIPEVPSLAPVVLYGSPGVYEVATAGDSILFAARGARRMKGIPYFVLGQTLYRLTAGHVLEALGAIAGTGRVSMADNGTQLMILVPGGAGYIFTADPDNLTEITDSGFRANGNPLSVVFVDGYFACTTDEGDKFTVSALRDGLSWDALDAGTAESSPDSGVVPFVFKNQLYIAGERTIEAFQNVGGADFPFQRTGQFFDQGVAGYFAITKTSDAVYFVGAGEDEEPAVWRMSGTEPVRVSTSAVDESLAKLSRAELANVFAWSYGKEGHYFVGFQLADSTMIYDAATERWHERTSRVTRGDDTVDVSAHRAACYVTAYGRTYVGDTLTGKVGVLDTDTYKEFGELIERETTLQPYQNNMQPFTVPMIEVTTEAGVGNADAPDPVIRLQVSRDGGRTFTDERARPLGKQGEYERRTVIRRNGMFKQSMVLKFRMTDPVKFSLLQVTADIQGAA